MSSSLLSDEEFLKLEKDFKFLSRAREVLGDLEKLSYVVVDIETTGLDPVLHEIIEIGALKIENKEIKGTYQTLIQPSTTIPPEIEKLTGISQEMVINQPSISEALSSFLKFASNSILIAHNADFDLSFLKEHFVKWLKMEFKNSSLCTMKLAQKLLPGLGNYRLDTVASYFNIPTPGRHRALSDAEITYQVWNKLLGVLRDRGIITWSALENFSHPD